MAEAIFDDVSQIIGNTPIVRLNLNKFTNTNITEEGHINSKNVEYLVKLEYTNRLSGSIKDRVAKKILSDAEKSCKIKSDTTLLIPTSGNLAISIALLAQRRGYKTIALVPERTTIDRIQLLKSLGIEIIRTPNEAKPGHSESNFDLAIKLTNEIANSIFTNSSNVQEHYEETAQEIYSQVGGKLDVLVVGVESGGTITGLAKNLKERIPDLKVVAVEPQHSRIQENKSVNPSTIKDRKVEDIGNNFTSSILDLTLIDEWIKVNDRDSFVMARKLISEGFLAGPSSGSVVSAALAYANTNISSLSSSIRILCILNDTARNYNSTLLSDEWLLENDMMDEETIRKIEYQMIEKYRAASVEDLQLPAAVTVLPNSTLSYAIELMLEREFSQLPVVDTNRKLLGYVSLASLQNHINVGDATLSEKIEKWVFRFRSRDDTNESNSNNVNGNNNENNKKNVGRKSRQKYQLITPDTPLTELAKFFEKHSFAVVTDFKRKFVLGVVTKIDLMTFINRRKNSGFDSRFYY
ncbi:465_t:CDS:2 [Diversispora eburnea]|uniref:465_t:CDS:1 n=1 Tax=Diversispora eburnea TaxID=1213867 RepID=A0A9N9AVX2_9GLOM|nr:465_t:CDS:2 [Diversispora eburnea]